MVELTGWLLDVYPDPAGGAALWLLGDDGVRHRFYQPFPVTFYAAGPASRLRDLWRFLRAQPVELELARAERRDLFNDQPLPVLAIQVRQAGEQPRLFQQVERAFPELSYYDADISLPLRFAAANGAFPLARCRLEASATGQIQALAPLDTPWDLDPPPPPLRVLSLESDCDPSHAAPQAILAHFDRFNYCFPLRSPRSLLVNLQALLQRHDPDLLLTTWGDTWLLPLLIALSQQWRIPLSLNRDAQQDVAYRPARTYFSYGQIIYRGEQAHLFGRWHVDRTNALLFSDFGMEGVLEFARVTSLPVQVSARVSPGTGISSMQMVTALRLGVMTPWHKQQSELPKSALDLLRRDQGGLVYQPRVGLHANIGEVDFVSMYPSLMVRFNISPETAGKHPGNPAELEPFPSDGAPGLVPQTLAPLLEKRLSLKARLSELPGWDPRRKTDLGRASAHKWLLVTCFGYLGYKNARFGRIEAHEAVTSYGREALLRAKEAAEDLGSEILHLYVDGMWVKHPGWSRPEDFQPLLEEVARRTGLSIALDGIYRWVVFLPSRVDARVPVANRYFGVFQDGTLKVRGIEARRRDTPHWITQIQMALLERMAQAPSAADLPGCMPALARLLRRALADLRAGRIPLDQLLVAQKLSRTMDAYRTQSPVARAVSQLEAIGKPVQPGQRVRFLLTLGRPGVHAWDLPNLPDPAALDIVRYRTLLLRAASTVLQPLGIDEQALPGWLLGDQHPLFQLSLWQKTNDICVFKSQIPG
jgi:DNA polymerase-2